MSGLGATLAKPVGPMPLGAWLVAGGAGLFFAWKARGTSGDSGPVETGDPLPTGGGLPTEDGIGSYDGAPVVLSPIFNVPAPIVNVNLPTPTQTPTPPVQPPLPTPRVVGRGTGNTGIVPPRTATPAPVMYTVKSGDTLWGIASRMLGSGARWTKLYADNKATIEAAAKAHGRSSSRGPSGVGHYIYPGTVLRVVK